MFAPKNKVKIVTEKIARLFHKDKSLTGILRSDIATALSIMIKKNFGISDKSKELLELMKPEVDNSRLREVVDFEVDYIRRSLEHELSKKDEEIKLLKAKLKENGIK